MSSLVTYLDLYMFIRRNGRDAKILHQFILNNIPTEISSEDTEILQHFCGTFVSRVNARWKESSRCKKTFFKKYIDWLETYIAWPQCSSVNLADIFSEEHTDENAEANTDMNIDVTDVSIDDISITSVEPSASQPSTSWSGVARSEIRSTLFHNSVTVLPSYYKLLKSKQNCYPPKQDITVTEQSAKIKLQALLDLTAKRILNIENVPFDPSNRSDLKLISKWGFDGSSSQSNYKQRQQTFMANFDDSSVFMTSLVPLRLESKDILLWENPNPSSTSYCRPVKFEFIKESNELVKREEECMNDEISALVPTEHKGIKIFHELHMTMINGKIVTIVSDTPSSSTCSICLSKPSEMNKLDVVLNKPLRENMLQYGLSSLHMWIRCMECILHVSYNMDFKMWSARDENKILKKAKKDATQQEFKEQTGILIDIVKQGYGTTNDGNTARRFFQDFRTTSEITKIDLELIKRLYVVLQTVSSGKLINIDHFRNYCRETAELYVKLYPWYYMPASVHKLLIHGADICKHFGFIPIGYLSEEASEARNKEFRNTREMHTRKTVEQKLMKICCTTF